MSDGAPKPSLDELAVAGKRALVWAVGGGGCIFQALPIARLFERLGVEVSLAGVSCAWWGSDGKPVGERPGVVVLGPTIFDVEGLSEAELVAAQVARVGRQTRWRDRRLAESLVAERTDAPIYVAGLRGGVAGMVAGLTQLIEQQGIGLVVGVDIGADTFTSGEETTQSHTPLVDLVALSALAQLPGPTAFCLSGYGCDGEMALEELDANVSRVMRAGGYLGAYGPTQADVREIEELCEAYADPVEVWTARAARGEFGWRKIPINTPWGQPIKVTPTAATILVFDPKVIVAEVARPAAALASTASLEEAERGLERLGLIPETRFVTELDWIADGD